MAPVGVGAGIVPSRGEGRSRRAAVAAWRLHLSSEHLSTPSQRSGNARAPNSVLWRGVYSTAVTCTNLNLFSHDSNPVQKTPGLRGEAGRAAGRDVVRSRSRSFAISARRTTTGPVETHRGGRKQSGMWSRFIPVSLVCRPTHQVKSIQYRKRLGSLQDLT